MKFFIEPSVKYISDEFKSKKILAYKVRKSGGWFDFNETILDELTFEEASVICAELNAKYKAGLIK